MNAVPEALVEKVAQALVEHPSIPANLNETMFYCPTCGADHDQIAGPNSPTHATHQARAVLAAVWPDLAEEKRRAIESALIFAAAHDDLPAARAVDPQRFARGGLVCGSSAADVATARPVVDAGRLAEVMHERRHLAWPCPYEACGHLRLAREDADAILASGVVRDAADVRRAALTEVADAWQHGQWSDVLLPATVNPIANGQRVTDWLRARATREAGGRDVPQSKHPRTTNAPMQNRTGEPNLDTREAGERDA